MAKNKKMENESTSKVRIVLESGAEYVVQLTEVLEHLDGRKKNPKAADIMDASQKWSDSEQDGAKVIHVNYVVDIRIPDNIEL